MSATESSSSSYSCSAFGAPFCQTCCTSWKTDFGFWTFGSNSRNHKWSKKSGTSPFNRLSVSITTFFLTNASSHGSGCFICLWNWSICAANWYELEMFWFYLTRNLKWLNVRWNLLVCVPFSWNSSLHRQIWLHPSVALHWIYLFVCMKLSIFTRWSFV